MTDKKPAPVVYPQYKKVIRTTKLNNGGVLYSGYVLESRGSWFNERHTVVEGNRTVRRTKEEVKQLVIKHIEWLKKEFLQEEHSSEEEYF